MKHALPWCCAVSAVALLLGCILVAACGYNPPRWMLAGELATVAGLSLAFGFTVFAPSLPDWLWLRPVRGAVCVCLGVAAMFTPPQLIVSTILLGIGTRLVWLSACEAGTEKSTAIRKAERGWLKTPTGGVPQRRRDD